MKKKILVLTSSYPRSHSDSTPAFVSELSKRLSEDFDIFILCPHSYGCSNFEIFNDCKVYRYRYAPLKLEKMAYGSGIINNLKQQRLLFLLVPFFVISQFIYALLLCIKHKITVVHAHWIIPQGIIAWALKFIGIINGYVITSHGSDLFSLQGRIFTLLKKSILNGASHITVVSSAMKDECVKIGIEKKHITIVSMGVELENFFVPSLEKVKNIDGIFVGRLVEKKGVKYLIKAWEQVVSFDPKLNLIIIGEGPERPFLEKMSCDLKLCNNILFLGSIHNTDIPDFYQSSKVAIMPSVDQEGLGLVAVEAIACGCHLIASDIPALYDVISEGINARMVPQRDSDAIANAVIEYLSDKYILKSNVLERYSNLKKKFDWKIVSEKYKKIIDFSLNNFRPAENSKDLRLKQ